MNVVVADQSSDYYVTQIRDTRVAYLAGPFETHAEALAMVDSARKLSCSLDVRGDFDAFGTARKPKGNGTVGKLNDQLIS